MPRLQKSYFPLLIPLGMLVKESMLHLIKVFPTKPLPSSSSTRLILWLVAQWIIQASLSLYLHLPLASRRLALPSCWLSDVKTDIYKRLILSLSVLFPKPLNYSFINLSSVLYLHTLILILVNKISFTIWNLANRNFKCNYSTNIMKPNG